MNNEIAIILLAAGPSSRMGQSKQQLLIEGKSLLVRSVEIAIQSEVSNIVVVLGSQADGHRKLLSNFSVDCVVNPRWQTGMGSSLKAGLSYATSKNPETTAVMMMVCDQPLLTADHLKLLIKKFQTTNATLVASAYADTLGVPALFSRQLFHEILTLDDQHGAKKVIQKHAAETVPFPEGDVDLDTPEDYRSFLQQRPKKNPD